MFHGPIICIWLFFTVLNGACDEKVCDVTAWITQFDTRPNSVAFRISTQHHYGPVSPYGMKIRTRCIQGPTVYPPVLFLSRYNSDKTIPVYYLSNGLFGGKEKDHYCLGGNEWVIPGHLDALNVSVNIYEVKYLQRDCTYNLYVSGTFSWDNMTDTCWSNLIQVDTESFRLPKMEKGYFWIQENQTSSTERNVTIFWSKTTGKALVELLVGDKMFPSLAKVIQLDRGFFTTSINMKRNVFQIRKLNYREAFIGDQKKLINIPDHDEQLLTSSWSFKYTQSKKYEAKLEWTSNEPQRVNVTEFIIYWFSDDDSVPVAFAHISPNYKGVLIESRFDEIPKIIGVGINADDPYSSSGLQFISMSDPNSKDDTQLIDDTEHVEQAYRYNGKSIQSPKTPRYIAGDDTEHIEEPFEPRWAPITPRYIASDDTEHVEEPSQLWWR